MRTSGVAHRDVAATVDSRLIERRHVIHEAGLAEAQSVHTDLAMEGLGRDKGTSATTPVTWGQ